MKVLIMSELEYLLLYGFENTKSLFTDVIKRNIIDKIIVLSKAKFCWKF